MEQPVNEDKIKAATSVLARLKSTEPEQCTQMERLSDAYIELAFLDVAEQKTNTQKPVRSPVIPIISTISELTANVDSLPEAP